MEDCKVKYEFEVGRDSFGQLTGQIIDLKKGFIIMNSRTLRDGETIEQACIRLCKLYNVPIDSVDTVYDNTY